MTIKYYFRNLLWPSFIFGVMIYYGSIEDLSVSYNVALGMSVLLYPMATKLIEDIALRYTTKEFWNKGIFEAGPAKNSMYVLYYFACYLSAIPLGLIYAILFLNKRRYSK